MSEPGLLLYLDCLFGAEPAGGLIEVRYRLPGRDGMAQRFFPCEDRSRAAAFIERQGCLSDTYVGVAPRRERNGSRAAVERVHALWLDLDTPAAIEALERFRPAPPVVIASGSGVHAYWPLLPPVSPDEAEQANRALAEVLGADRAATDAARILRPPETFNHKTDPPRPVVCERLEVAYLTSPTEIIGALPDPAPSAPGLAPTPRPAQWQEADDPLRGILAEEYIPALTGRQVGRDRKVKCPFHADGQERTPSLHVYPDHGGWACFACDRGGTIIDFGAHLYALQPRGEGYHRIRQRLAADLLARWAAA